MDATEKQRLKEALPISKVLLHYGAQPTRWYGAFHCFRHEDKHPSLVANDERGVATCESPKCDIKRGSDIFEIIKLVEGCNFGEAVKRAYGIASTTPERLSPVIGSYNKPRPTRDASVLPETTPLEKRHCDWLQHRYGEGWQWVAEHFRMRGTRYHLALPIDETGESMVFLPLKQRTKANPSGDTIFYRGKERGCQVFPNRPAEHQQARSVFVCEGEKDVMRVTWELHQQGLLGTWTAITNTIGAGNVREETELFTHCDPSKVQRVVLCYDNDLAGKKANGVVYRNAKAYFTAGTSIETLAFHSHHPSGYDITDWLNEPSVCLLDLLVTRQHQRHFSF